MLCFGAMGCKLTGFFGWIKWRAMWQSTNAIFHSDHQRHRMACDVCPIQEYSRGQKPLQEQNLKTSRLCKLILELHSWVETLEYSKMQDGLWCLVHSALEISYVGLRSSNLHWRCEQLQTCLFNTRSLTTSTQKYLHIISKNQLALVSNFYGLFPLFILQKLTKWLKPQHLVLLQGFWNNSDMVHS